MRLSYSQLEWFLRCPFVYKYIYIDKNSIPRGKDAVFGGLLHSVLERVYKDRPAILTLSEALAFFEKEWERGQVASYFATPLDARMHFKEGLIIINGYYQKNELEKTRIIALEKLFEVPLEDPRGKEIHLLTGRIDRVDQLANGLEVIDYKTSKSLKSQAQIAKDLQLSLYHLGIASLWPDLVKRYEGEVYVSLYFLRHNEKVSVKKSAKEIEETKEKLLDYIHQITEATRKNSFEPKASILCAIEPYCRICPYFSDRYRTAKPPLPNKQEVAQIITEYIALKIKEKEARTRLSQLNEIINAYLDDQKLEAIYEGDEGITRSSIPFYELDLALVKKILQKLGKWEDVLEVSKTKLKKLTNELPMEYRQKLKEAQKLKKIVNILRMKKIA